MQIKKLIIPILSLLLASGAFWYSSKSKVGYINLSKVFNEFQMKKELQKDFDQKVRIQQQYLDSAQMELIHLRSEWDKDRNNISLYQQLTEMNERNRNIEATTEKNIQELTQKFDGQIQDRLKQYLKEFGENRGLDILMGNIEDGSLLYGKENIDYTDEAIQFVNEKYLDK